MHEFQRQQTVPLRPSLPTPRKKHTTPALERQALARSGPKKLYSVLIVEDDASLRRALEIRLTQQGVLATSTSDGPSAAWQLVAQRFDAVVLDLGLPGKNGLEVMADVAHLGALPPVLVLTGAAKEDQDRALELGASCVLSKPCSFSEIAKALQEMLIVPSGSIPLPE